jgi:peptidoglycan/xylan/chitin deacetylase (PgdA/CDA1 family)
MHSVPILTYHQISPVPHPSYARFTVTPQAFRRQMAWLAARGYSSITLDDLVAARAGRQPLPAKPIVLTFDDGCVEAVEHAADVLPRHGFTAIFYLVTDLMGTASTWTLARRHVAFPLIDWAAARRLVEAGFTCGSHTATHRRLAELTAAECRDELGRSRAVLQDRLGREVVHLSYPYGSFNPAVRELAAEAGYVTACSVQSGLSRPSDDMLALHRLNIGSMDTFTDFRFRVVTGKCPDEVLPRPMYSLARRAKALFNQWTGQARSTTR